MTALRPRRMLLAFAATPLILALAACGKDGAADAAPKGDAIAKVAAPAGQKWEDMVQATADGGMLMGNPNAPIKLIEYGSLSCPHCAKFAQEGMEPLKRDFVATGRVSYEFRSFAIHPQDIPLTMLVRCAPKEAFFPLVEQVYTNFEAMNAPLQNPEVQQAAQAASQLPAAQRFPALSDALQFTAFFAARGVSVDQAHACLGKLETATEIAGNAKKYGESGITGTPTFMLNGKKIEADSWETVRALLEQAGAR